MGRDEKRLEMEQQVKVSYIASDAIPELEEDIRDVMFEIGFAETGQRYWKKRSQRDISFVREVAAQAGTIHTE